MLVISVMSGFQKYSKDTYTIITSELLVDPYEDSAPGVQERLEAIAGVAATTPVAIGQGMVVKNGVGGVYLIGTDLDSSYSVTPWEGLLAEGPVEQATDLNWIWVGFQLAKKLRIGLGDKVNVLFVRNQRKRVIPFEVTALTKFGMYEHDLRYARIDFDVAREIFQVSMPPRYQVKLEENADLEEVKNLILKEMGEDVYVTPWYEMNKNHFASIEHQKQWLFLILEIIVLLASLNVVNLLLMSAHNKSSVG